MKIHIPNPSDFVPGSIGGQYIQGGSSVASLRSKRNGGNRVRQSSFPPRATFSQIARSWRGLSSANKASWYAWGVSSGSFPSLDPSSPTFAFNIFLAFHIYRWFINPAILASPSALTDQTPHTLILNQFTSSPFACRVRHDLLGGNARDIFYATALFSNTITTNYRSIVFVGERASSTTTSVNVAVELQRLYGPMDNVRSVICRSVRIRATGQVFAIGSPVQFFPTDVP